MASQSNSDMWMGAAASDISMLSNLEEGSSWKTPASSQNTTNHMDVKDNIVATANFSKGLLEEEWYAPEPSLLELSSYTSASPFNLSSVDTRSNFGLLESSLTFDAANNLITGFRSVPSAMCMEDLGQPGSSGLFSSISQGGQLSRTVPMDSFSSGLPPTIGNINNNHNNNHNNHNNNHNQGSILNGGLTNTHLNISRNSSMNNRSTNFPPSFLPSYQATITPFHNIDDKQFHSKSPPKAANSNEDSGSPGGKGCSSPNMQEDPNDMGLDADEYDAKDDDDLDESGDGDGSGGPEEGAGNGNGHGIHGVSEVGGNGGKSGKTGKQRGLPAKNLMAERRRRKKLNDRLYMLRSVVPKITKMDRASILGDAIEYLKELLQRISDIHNELEAAKQEQSRSLPSSPTGGRGIHHGIAPPAVKEECPVLPNPENQSPRVEVRQRDQALNVHMFCARRPGLLLSTVRALDALGLDVQQAVISCFNGFALDLFRAEAKDVDIGPDEIKAVLLLTAGCGVHSLQ